MKVINHMKKKMEGKNIIIQQRKVRKEESPKDTSPTKYPHHPWKKRRKRSVPSRKCFFLNFCDLNMFPLLCTMVKYQASTTTMHAQVNHKNTKSVEFSPKFLPSRTRLQWNNNMQPL